MASKGVPTIRELMGEGPFPFAIEEVMKRLTTEGLFAPWVSLDEDGHTSAIFAADLFSSWKRAERLVLMCQPEGGDMHRPIHSAMRSFGGVHFYTEPLGNNRIDENAAPFSPIVFGGEVVVRTGARLGGPLIIGRGAQIGSSHVSRAVIFPGARIASNVTLGDSLVGPNCVIEAGVAVRSRSGRRDERGYIMTRWFSEQGDHQDVCTKRKILGGIFGAGCMIEADTEPGSIFSAGCHVRAWMKGLPAGIYTPKILDAMQKRWESEMLGRIADACASNP